MTTHVLPYSPPRPAPDQAQAQSPRRAVRDFTIRRLPAAIVALGGVGLVVYGVSLAWLTTFGGLLSQSGWGTRNGMILFYGALGAGAVALVQLIVGSTPLRWLLAFGGFGLTAFSGWLLIQLYTVSNELDGMTLAQKGPGLFVTTAGAALIFFTVFLPMPQAAASGSPASGAVDTDVDTAAVGQSVSIPTRQVLPAWMTWSIGSRLRYPIAALAVVAGLAHVPVTPEHLQEAPYIGVLFILLTIVCVLSASALLLSDTKAVYLVVGIACTLAVAAYIVSRTVGLPLMGDDVGNWLETLGVVSVTAETGVAVLSAVVLTRSWRSPRG